MKIDQLSKYINFLYFMCSLVRVLHLITLTKQELLTCAKDTKKIIIIEDKGEKTEQNCSLYFKMHL